MSARVLLVLFAILVPQYAGAFDEPGPPMDGIMEKYLEASKSQQQNLRGVTMDVEISAELPKLKKSGKLQALRKISQLGKITYDALRFEGDNTIKKEIIARYLSTEIEATEKTAPPITPDFYKFRYKGAVERAGFAVYLIQVSPKKKLPGSFKGEVWLDKATCLPVRESGRLVKNPSVFVKQFDFVRSYEIKDGVAIPKQTTGVVETRLWGKAEMNIDYTNFSKTPSSAVLTSDPDVTKSPH